MMIVLWPRLYQVPTVTGRDLREEARRHRVVRSIAEMWSARGRGEVERVVEGGSRYQSRMKTEYEAAYSSYNNVEECDQGNGKDRSILIAPRS